MSYAIRGLMPTMDAELGGHGFSVDLPAEWLALVEDSGLTQGAVSNKIQNVGNEWLDACGFSQKSSHDGKRLYEARTAIRVSWGKWGAEHISVPGNACGLDIDRGTFGSVFPGGARLGPHNVDSWRQVQLLLIVFTEFAEDVLIFSRCNRLKKKPTTSEEQRP